MNPLIASKILLGRRITALITLSTFLLTSGIAPVRYAYGQELFQLPQPGTRVSLSPAFAPPLLKGVKVYPDNPFRLDFILDKGNSSDSAEQLKSESTRLIKYFLASITVPEKDLWVNLSPYEKDRIVPDAFGVTEMGRDLLAQDYMLKQITASVIYPEGEVGKAFWAKVYAEAQKRYGTSDVPVDTFNKVWIVPEKAVVYESKDSAYVVESKLKVMLEEDYLALEKNTVTKDQSISATNKLGSDIVREVVIPILEKEVNEGKNFAQLRQVYHSLILAIWYKDKVKESIFGEAYVDQKKTGGVDIEDKAEKEKIWEQYVEAFKKGAYNYIKEDLDPTTQQPVPRKYFSGGNDLTGARKVIKRKPANQLRHDYAQLLDGVLSSAEVIKVDMAMVGKDATMVVQTDKARRHARQMLEDFFNDTESTLYSLIRSTQPAGRQFIEQKNEVLNGKAFGVVLDLLRTLLTKDWLKAHQEHLQSTDMQEFVGDIVEPLLVLYDDQGAAEFHSLLKDLALEFMAVRDDGSVPSAKDDSLDEVVAREFGTLFYMLPEQYPGLMKRLVHDPGIQSLFQNRYEASELGDGSLNIANEAQPIINLVSTLYDLTDEIERQKVLRPWIEYILRAVMDEKIVAGDDHYKRSRGSFMAYQLSSSEFFVGLWVRLIELEPDLFLNSSFWNKMLGSVYSRDRWDQGEGPILYALARFDQLLRDREQVLPAEVALPLVEFIKAEPAKALKLQNWYKQHRSPDKTKFVADFLERLKGEAGKDRDTALTERLLNNDLIRQALAERGQFEVDREWVRKFLAMRDADPLAKGIFEDVDRMDENSRQQEALAVIRTTPTKKNNYFGLGEEGAPYDTWTFERWVRQPVSGRGFSQFVLREINNCFPDPEGSRRFYPNEDSLRNNIRSIYVVLRAIADLAMSDSTKTELNREEGVDRAMKVVPYEDLFSLAGLPPSVAQHGTESPEVLAKKIWNGDLKAVWGKNFDVFVIEEMYRYSKDKIKGITPAVQQKWTAILYQAYYGATEHSGKFKSILPLLRSFVPTGSFDDLTRETSVMGKMLAADAKGDLQGQYRAQINRWLGYVYKEMILPTEAYFYPREKDGVSYLDPSNVYWVPVVLLVRKVMSSNLSKAINKRTDESQWKAPMIGQIVRGESKAIKIDLKFRLSKVDPIGHEYIALLKKLAQDERCPLAKRLMKDSEVRQWIRAFEERTHSQILDADATMKDSTQKGGIDLTGDKMGIQIKAGGQGVQFKFDPAMIQQLQKASGLTPVIIDIQPMTTTVPIFLGIKDSARPRP